MAESETLITVTGKPGFLDQASAREFHVVQSVKQVPGGFYYEYVDSTNMLREGLDIREIPTRGLGLIVQILPGRSAIPYVVEECRKFATVASCDYVGVDYFGKCLGKVLCVEGSLIAYEVRPRLFNEIHS